MQGGREAGQRWAISARRLVVFWCLLFAADAIALYGLSQLKFGHGLERVFRSDSARYEDYDRLRQIQGPLYGLQVLIEAEDLADPAARNALIDFVLEAQLEDGVAAVLSPFTVPIPVPGDGVVTLDAPEADIVGQWARAQDVQPLLQSTLAKDRQSALVTILSRESTGMTERIDALAADILPGAGVVYAITGLPAFLAHNAETLLGDFVWLNSLGALAGTLIAFAAIRGWWVAGVTLLSSGTALLWGMGTLGLVGVEINVLSVALPILLLALAFADAVHLGIELRQTLQEGVPRPVRTAVARVGPAVLLTSLTTSIAFLSLTLSGSALIAEMGIGGALAVLAASAGVLAANAVLGVTALRFMGRGDLRQPHQSAARRIFDWSALPEAGLRHGRVVIIAGVGLTVLATALYLSAPTRYSYLETMRVSDPLREARARIEEKLGPASSLLIPVTLDGADPVAAARAVTETLRDLSPGAMPLSLALLADAAEAAGTDYARLVEDMPDALLAIMGGDGGETLVVSLPFRYESSAQTRALVAEVEAALAARPIVGATIGRPTGPEVMSAFVSDEMIRALSRGLLVSVFVCSLLIALWRRSLRAGLLSLAPNLLPVAMVGAVLAVSGLGISFAGGIALTLAFGIAVDDTIHVMNRHRIESGPKRVERTMRAVTAPIVITTLVLVGGLSGTLAASLPTVLDFGLLAMGVFCLAVLSDLVFLPALLKRFMP